MSEPIIITATVSAWLSEYHRPDELMTNIENGEYTRAISMLSLYGPAQQESFGDYTRIGEADVTVRLLPHDQQTRLAVERLNKELEKLRAAYQKRQSQILAEISKLSAITYEAEAA